MMLHWQSILERLPLKKTPDICPGALKINFLIQYQSVLGQICAQIKAPAMCLHTPQKVGSCAPDWLLAL